MRNFWTGVIVFFVIIISIWIQLNIFNNIPLFGVKPNIGIVLSVAISILCGQGIGISVGIVQGIFYDVIFGKVFGMYTLLYFLVGFFCGKMSKGFSKENKNSIIMITSITTVIFELLSCFVFLILYNYEFEIITLLKKVILETIYNMFIASVLFKFFSNLSEIINKGKKSYYLL